LRIRIAIATILAAIAAALAVAHANPLHRPRLPCPPACDEEMGRRIMHPTPPAKWP